MRKEVIAEIVGIRDVPYHISSDDMYLYISWSEESIEDKYSFYELANLAKLRAIELGYILIEYPQRVKIYESESQEYLDYISNLLSEPFHYSRVLEAFEYVMYLKEKETKC